MAVGWSEAACCYVAVRFVTRCETLAPCVHCLQSHMNILASTWAALLLIVLIFANIQVSLTSQTSSLTRRPARLR